MLHILKQDYDVNEKLSVSIFFKTFLNNLILKKEITKEERRMIFMELISTDPSVMVHLTQCIESILFFDEASLGENSGSLMDSGLDPDKPDQLLNILFTHMIDGLSSNNYQSEVDKIKMFLSLFRVAVNVIQDTSVLAAKVNEHKALLAAAAEKSLDGLKNSFNNANQEEALVYSGLVHEFTTICKESTAKIGKDSRTDHIQYLTSDELMKIFREIIFLGFPHPKVFFDSGDSQLNQKIYSSKTNMIKILSTLVSIIKPHLHMNTLAETTFAALLKESVSMFLAELLEFSATEDFRDNIADDDVKLCATAVLTTLAQLTYTKEYHEEYAKYGSRLLTDIGFMYGMTLDAEKREMVDNPAEFVKVALDVCDRQKFTLIKSQSAKFVETIGDKVSGVFNHNCLLASEILEQAVMNDQNLDNYPLLKDHYAESTFCRTASNEDKIDCSIMMLTMSSYALPKDDNLREKFTVVVEKITQPIMQMNSLLLNCRLTIMLGYYMDILYRQNEDVFLSLLEMFMNSLSSSTDCMALAIQSADTLNTIVNDNDIIPRVVPILPNLVQKVSECILKVNIVEFFDFVSEIFKFYKDKLTDDDFCLLFRHHVERIIIEVKKILGPNNGEDLNPSSIKTSMSAQKCWNTIMGAIEEPAFLTKYIGFIEEELKPIFQLLARPKVIDFDDDVVKAMRMIINESKSAAPQGTAFLSDTMKELFPYLKNSFEKHAFVFTELFDCVKAYSKADKQFVVSNSNHVNMLFGFGVDCLYSGDHVPNACVYLIQLFLTLKSDGDESLNLVIPEVLKQIIERANHKPMNSVLKRIIYGVIMAAMMSNHRATFEYLESHGLTLVVFEEIMKFSIKKIENPVERKLHAVILTNLLTQEELPDVVKECSPKIIERIVQVLVKTSDAETKKAKKKDKQQIEFDDFDSDFDSDSDSELDSEGDYNFDELSNHHNIVDDSEDATHPLGNEEEKKDEGNESTDENENDELLETEIDIQSSFTIIKTNFNTFDEFNYFKYVMQTLYKNHGAQMDQLVAQIPEGVKKSLHDLMQVQKVEVEGGKKMHRKVIKARRTLKK